MLELKTEKLPLKINEKEFQLTPPTYANSLEYDSALSACGDDSAKKAECLFDYLEKLGLPKSDSKMLGMNHISKIIEYVSGQKKS